MPHTEYEDLVDKACEANERSHDNKIELKDMQEKLKALAARMDIQAAREADSESRGKDLAGAGNGRSCPGRSC